MNERCGESNTSLFDSRLPQYKKLGNSFTHHRNGDQFIAQLEHWFSPFFLNYGHEPVTTIQLLRGNEEMKTESATSFIQRVTSDWNLARENL